MLVYAFLYEGRTDLRPVSTDECHSTIPRPSATFGCSKCSKRSLAASAHLGELSSFAVFALTCPRCTNKVSICSPPCSKPFLVILSSRLYRGTEELPPAIDFQCIYRYYLIKDKTPQHKSYSIVFPTGGNFGVPWAEFCSFYERPALFLR